MSKVKLPASALLPRMARHALETNDGIQLFGAVETCSAVARWLPICVAEDRISILTPIGAALIGMSVAQCIEWPTPTGRTDQITVLDVVNDG